MDSFEYALFCFQHQIYFNICAKFKQLIFQQVKKHSDTYL